MIARALALFSLLPVAAGLALAPRSSFDWAITVVLPFAFVGALIATRRPRNPIGWLYLAFGLNCALVFAAHSYAYRALVMHPGTLPAGDVAASLDEHAWHPSFGFIVFSFLLFPRGRLLSPRWRWVAGAALVTYAGLAVSGIFESAFQRQESDLPVRPLFGGLVDDVASSVWGVLLLTNVLLLVVAGLSLVLRLRRSHGEERQQVKWFVYAVAFVLFFFPFGLFVLGNAPIYLFPLIPVSAALAIFKYRLYDIDVVINRTLVYGALTAILAGAYLASVLLLQLLLRPSSDLAVAGSTLAVAALFRPARARVQTLVDRRFYRRKYDAQRTLETFAGRLRDEVALEALGAELRTIVADTMQPAHVSLWLRPRA